MAQRMPKEAGKLSIPERQSELKEFVNQTLWEGSREVRLDGVRKILEYSMQEERERYLKAGWYQRCGERKGYASGYYRRNFLTGEGLLEGLRVPRTRDGKFRSWALGRYSRRSGRIDELIRSMFLNGVSTRDVNEVLIKFVGAGVSPQTVCTLAAELDTEVQKFHRRALEDTYVCILLDAVILKSREFGKGKKRAILTAVGITADGRRSLIDFLPAESEGEAQWMVFLNDLYRRGLEGKQPLLITTDGAPGIALAVQMVYPRAAHQRCWVHKLRNVSNKLKKKDREACIRQARRIYQAPNKSQAIKEFWKWARKWRSAAPLAVKCVEKDLKSLLEFFRLPKELWETGRTTNPIERAFREVRKRTRPIGCFNNDKSIERFVYGTVEKVNNRWNQRYPGDPQPLFAQKS